MKLTTTVAIRLVVSTFMCTSYFTAYTQTDGVEVGTNVTQYLEDESEFKRHRIMAVLGHTHVPRGVNEEGDKSWLILGSIGLDYDYRIDYRWSIGLHTDLVFENFSIEENDGVVLERSRPLLVALCVSRKLGRHLSLLTGIGEEFAKEKNLVVGRLGVDYAWELPQEWEVALSLMWDIKFGEYDAWVFGIGIGKAF